MSGTPEPKLDTFADVARSCRDWLYKHDPKYREASDTQKRRAHKMRWPDDY